MHKITLIKWQTLILTILFFGSCSDWGKMDPPAGNQVYPKLERVSSFSFNTMDDAFELLTYPDGTMPALEDDEVLGKVLYLNGGYLKMSNPLNHVSVQNAVSLTFWIKQPGDSENEVGIKRSDATQEQDLKGAIFSFANENASQRVFFTANGWLSYEGADGVYEYNNPSSVSTGIITPGKWQYVAIIISNTGYLVYVDGKEAINHTETVFDFSKMVRFMATAPYFYVGYGSGVQPGEMWIDDLNIYRNTITNTQIKTPEIGKVEQKNYITIGKEDYSTAWWSVWSEIVKMTGDQTIHFGFYNHTNGSANWNNWVIVVTNGKFTGGGGDGGAADEFFVLRADAYGWGGSHAGENISHNYNWDTFTNDMKGAYVDLTIKRTGNRIDLTAVTTTKEGTVYTMNHFCEADFGTTVGAFLTCEGSYLEIDPEDVYVGDVYTPNSYVVGLTNMTTPWWSYFTELTKITGDTPYPFAYTFINYTNGLANWNNWVIVVTNGKFTGVNGDGGAADEYFVLRADAYGWGGSHVGDNISHNYNWDTFTNDMKGATCKVTLTRKGNRVDLTAKTTTTSGTVYTMTHFCEDISTSEIGVFFVVEGAYMDMRSVVYYPFLKISK